MLTVAGERHDLPKPFHVLATQNPIEQEGTYPLPEAQLDRFLMQIDVGYPDRDAERRMLLDTTGSESATAKNALSAEELMTAQRLVRRLPVGEKVRRRDPRHRAVQPARARRGSARSWPGVPAPRLAGADAGDTRPRADRRTARAVGRRRGRARGAGSQAPHGAQLWRAGPRRDDQRHHRHADLPARLNALVRRPHQRDRPAHAARRSPQGAESLAGAMPRLAADARRASAGVMAGVHGRRRAGQGESFWQFRQFASGEAAHRIDWRRSARDDRLYVREREWEAAQAIWLFHRPITLHGLPLQPGSSDKQERAIVLALAAADMLVRGGRTRRPDGNDAGDLIPPRHRTAWRRACRERGSWRGLAADSTVATQRGDHRQRLSGPASGSRPQPQDPRRARRARVPAHDQRSAEEVFPFSGQTEFLDPEDGYRLRSGAAEELAATYKDRLAAAPRGAASAGEQHRLVAHPARDGQARERVPFAPVHGDGRDGGR